MKHFSSAGLFSPVLSQSTTLLPVHTRNILPCQSARDEDAIRAVIRAQSDACNHADIPASCERTKTPPIRPSSGQKLEKAIEPILQRYSRATPKREQMGTLNFSEIDIRLLPSGCGKSEIALVTGKFHLDRTAHGEAAKDDGISSLVWRKGPQGWKIISTTRADTNARRMKQYRRRPLLKTNAGDSCRLVQPATHVCRIFVAMCTCDMSGG